MGKIGGFLGVFTFAFFMHWHGLPAAEGAAAIVSILGLITTIFLLPETKGKASKNSRRSHQHPSRRPPHKNKSNITEGIQLVTASH
jgi:PHS family inorganic phosphate transporter-like MFS transporter